MVMGRVPVLFLEAQSVSEYLIGYCTSNLSRCFVCRQVQPKIAGFPDDFLHVWFGTVDTDEVEVRSSAFQHS